MNLYLDDDTVDKLLIRLLRRAGHDVLIPSDVGLSGKHDPIHLAHAINFVIGIGIISRQIWALEAVAARAREAKI